MGSAHLAQVDKANIGRVTASAQLAPDVQWQRAVLCYKRPASHRWLFFRYNVSAVETRPLRVQRLRNGQV